MAQTDDALRRFDALIAVALRLAGTAPSGKVVFAKLAASVEPEWIPRPWGDPLWRELEAAEAAGREPIPWGTVESILRDAWGGKPTDELDDLDAEPLAVTPTSQVHRGVLDGAPVAVKVRRPGLAASVRQDLTLLESLLGPLGAAFPGIDPQALVREARERVLDELDLEQEAGMQRRFARALRSHPFFTVPAPVTRLAQENVLVSAFVEGTPLREASQPERDQGAARLVLFVLGGLRNGLVHADADPQDVLLTADGRLAVLDYGATAAVEPERADLALALVEAYAASDGEALGDALQQLGLLDAGHGRAALELARHTLGPLGEAEPSRLDPAAIVTASRRLGQRPEAATEIALAGGLPPQDLWTMRGIASLFGTVARIEATASWRELVQAALRDGWDAGT